MNEIQHALKISNNAKNINHIALYLLKYLLILRIKLFLLPPHTYPPHHNPHFHFDLFALTYFQVPIDSSYAINSFPILIILHHIAHLSFSLDFVL